MNVVSVPTEVPAAQRAQWLAELSEALDQAKALLNNLGISGERSPGMFELYLRIEAARLEVHSLRLSRSLHPRDNHDPEWTRLPPWTDKPFD